jgi:phosphoribosylaminoimidazole carboxylase PurE protein
MKKKTTAKVPAKLSVKARSVQVSESASVAIIMGSDSDWRVMKKAKDMLDRFKITSIAKVVSAHRTPDELPLFAAEAEGAGVQVIIAGAGGAAHLPGMMASYSQLPVIGVPINATALNGLDALLAIVQMPEGIPVATVAIENAGNAALLAVRILALNNESVRTELDAFKKDMASKSREKTKNLK